MEGIGVNQASAPTSSHYRSRGTIISQTNPTPMPGRQTVDKNGLKSPETRMNAGFFEGRVRDVYMEG